MRVNRQAGRLGALLLGGLLIVGGTFWLAKSVQGAAKKKGYLGVAVQELTPTMREEMKVGDRDGLLISEVFDNSPADDAGLREGDVIVEFNGKSASRITEFSSLVRQTQPGTKVKITVIRDGASKDFEVTIGRRRSRTNVFSFSPGGERNVFFISDRPVLGVRLQELNSDLAAYFKVDPEQGVLVLEVDKDGAAAKAGIKAGDVITRLEGEKVASVQDVYDVLDDYDEGDQVAVELVRHGATQHMSVTLEEGRRNYRFFSRSLPRVYLQGQIPYDVLRDLKYDLPDVQIHIDELRDRLRDSEFQIRDRMRESEEKLHENLDRLRLRWQDRSVI